MRNIIIKGARQNNLKNLDLKIPRNKIVVFTGVSGSGKSSLVFETINAEAQRQLYDTFSTFARSRMPKYEQADYDLIENLSPAILIEQKRFSGNSRSTVGTVTEIYTYLRLLFSRIGSEFIGGSNHFSFNSPEGMCEHCSGTGFATKIEVDALIDWNKTINNGGILFSDFKVGSIFWKQIVMSNLFDCDKPFKNFSEKEIHDFLYAKSIRHDFGDEEGFLKGNYEGLYRKINRLYLNKDIASLSKKKQDVIKNYIHQGTCDQCNGTRLNSKALSVTIHQKNIFELCEMQLNQLSHFISQIKNEMVATVLEQIQLRLQYLINIGVGYLNLSRETSTLSGGEAQRVKLAKQLGSSLTEMIYILDEPSVGLHPRDVHLVNELFKELKAGGNTVLIVEHDPDVIKIADHIIDIGPHAGVKGGKIMYQGDFKGLQRADTLTGKFLHTPIPKKEPIRNSNEYFTIEKATSNNLKNITVKIPKELFVCITGVAGSGKSSLIHQEFLKKNAKAIVIDQSPVGQSERSNSATYTGVFDLIRKVFAKQNKVSSALFSFNSKGACPKCNGLGYITIDMAFLDAVKSKCEECNGKRYNHEVLTYKYQGKNIHEVLELTIQQAYEFFAIKEIQLKLKLLIDVGLGYLKLGQPLSTLSGGECQRVKLASELHKEGNIYIMDEPTTGLHMSDIQKIIELMNQLVDNGNSLIVIEHNLDVINNADWIIDIGPEGGIAGGELVFEGTPDKIVLSKTSYTGRYLKEYKNAFK
ncbi:ATP-binding cassette domain-containing protein [Flammeovirga agarivorans]|uniref:UvrABC system protein A n=1 Tax=Flammeovirga agarivorans TaxID=2726742 RepID=A0A7X8XVM6_9BACT|nr:excinuclease ABC subunit UvrA [Flammeovirga agarivorans]NLR91441.1 excinuclease ABC subunit UvrA [Flammeovirga agarivorans]